MPEGRASVSPRTGEGDDPPPGIPLQTEPGGRQASLPGRPPVIDSGSAPGGDGGQCLPSQGLFLF